MTRNVWLFLWVTVSLAAPVVIGQHARAKDRDMRHARIQSGALQPSLGVETEVVEEFERRLREYDAVRQQLDASLPVQSVSSNPSVIIAIVEVHQQALRSQRHAARQGDMFFPSVARLFRHWIVDSLHGMTSEEFVAMITENDGRRMTPPSVNASYPDGGALTTMPPNLLQTFPRLPLGLEYRFIDRDLILWDPHANVIIDFIPHAVPLWNES